MHCPAKAFLRVEAHSFRSGRLALASAMKRSNKLLGFSPGKKEGGYTNSGNAIDKIQHLQTRDTPIPDRILPWI